MKVVRRGVGTRDEGEDGRYKRCEADKWLGFRYGEVVPTYLGSSRRPKVSIKRASPPP